MGSKVRNASRIAGRQHGVITTEQLVAAEVVRSSVSKWRKKGLLHPEFRGVWRFGHRAPSYEARYMAAVLACGAGAGLSGQAALFHYGLLRGDPPPPEVASPNDRDVPGVTHHRKSVPTRIWRGLPTVPPAEAIRSAATTLSLDALARICHDAEIMFGLRDVPRAGFPGAPKLRAIYDGDHALLLSRLEREFRRLLIDRGLPLPVTNRRAGAHWVDCRWPDQRLTVELDSYRFHRSRHAWESDHERRRAARRRGDEFRRFTWHDVFGEDEPMLDELRRLLAHYPSLATAR